MAEAFYELAGEAVGVGFGGRGIQLSVAVYEPGCHDRAGEGAAGAFHAAHAKAEAFRHLKKGERVHAGFLCEGADDGLAAVEFPVVKGNGKFFFIHVQYLLFSV